MSGPPRGWWLALEPLADAEVVWALSSDSALDGPVAAGLLEGTEPLAALGRSLLPGAVDVAGGAAGAEELLWGGPLGSPDTEREAAVRLGGALLPPELTAALLDCDPALPPPVVTVAARGWLAALPWPSLALDERGDVRLVERASVLGGLSAALSVGLAPVSATAGDRPLLVVDPGPPAGATPPLYTGTARSRTWRPLARSLAEAAGCTPGDVLWPSRGSALTSEVLSELLSRPGLGSFTYVGHVEEGPDEAPARARLVLADDDAGDVLSAHRWLSDPQRWPAPPRVAFVACGSDDTRLLERSGLPVAALHAGAELVTATRWSLPADGQRGPEEGPGPFSQLATAVARATAGPRPLDDLRDWQLDQLAHWRRSGDRCASPLLWGSLVTYSAGAQHLRRPPAATSPGAPDDA